MKPNTTIAARFALALALVAPAAVAADHDDNGKEPWVPVKHLEFSDDDIEGGVLGPEGELLQSINKAEHDSLIEIRQGFEPEIVKMLEDL